LMKFDRLSIHNWLSRYDAHKSSSAHHQGKVITLSILKRLTLNISAKIKQLLPAQPCMLCGAMSRNGLCCKACEASLPYLAAAHCPICALPSSLGEVCGHCLKNPPVFTRTVAAFSYQFPLDKLIQGLKYRQQLALADFFADKLLHKIDPENLPDYLIAMPLHPAKLRQRGFNQAQLIAAKLAKKLHLPFLPHACKRLRDTPSQTTLPWRERSKNMTGAFHCEMDLSGKRVALIDDVLTTGASLNALADAVQKCGANDISAWVVARTVRD
jgi:ComF family protein